MADTRPRVTIQTDVPSSEAGAAAGSASPVIGSGASTPFGWQSVQSLSKSRRPSLNDRQISFGPETKLGSSGDSKVAGVTSSACTSTTAFAPSAEEPPYSVFPNGWKKLILGLVTMTAFLSPMTSNIYMSAIPSVARDLMQSQENIQLTVTVFMIAQGLSPMVLGSNTDKTGRKPVYLISLVIYLGACIGVYLLPDATASTKSGVYAGLMVLRALQAVGSSSVMSVGSGTVADLFPPATRGSAMGVFVASYSVAPAISPLIGAAITSGCGWRYIFLFCFALAAFCVVMLLFFLPETLRKIVGNGSKPAPTVVHESLFCLLTGKTVTQRTGEKRPGLPLPCDPAVLEGLSPMKRRMTLFYHEAKDMLSFTPLKFLLIPEVVLCLLGYAFPFAAQMMILSTIAKNFEQHYGFTVMQSGLVFISTGSGAMCAALITGRVLNWNYRRVAQQTEERLSRDAENAPAPETVITEPIESVATSDKQMDREKQGTISTAASSANLYVQPAATPAPPVKPVGTDGAKDLRFPIEKARLMLWPYMIGINFVATLAYGWCVGRTSCAAPIVFLFLNGFTVGTLSTIFQNLMLDFLPGRSAGVSASSNFIRCLLGAAGTACIEYMVDAMGTGGTYTVVAGISALSVPGVVTIMIYGPSWRAKRFGPEVNTDAR